MLVEAKHRRGIGEQNRRVEHVGAGHRGLRVEKVGHQVGGRRREVVPALNRLASRDSRMVGMPGRSGAVRRPMLGAVRRYRFDRAPARWRSTIPKRRGPEWRTAPRSRYNRPASMMRRRKPWSLGVAGSLKICSGGPSSHTTPSARKHDPARDLPGEAHLVGGEQHRQPVLLRSRTMFSTSPTSSGSRALVISSSSSTRGLHRERPHDRHPLLLAAREPVRVLVALVGEADALEQRHRARLGVAPCCASSTCIGASVMLSQHRHVREEVEALEHDADVAAQPRRRRRPTSVMRSPSIVIDPPSIVSSTLMQRSSVDFPRARRRR